MRVVSVGLLALAVVGCGGLRQATHFDGRPEARVVEPAEVGEEAALPPGHEALGQLRAECTLREGPRAIEGEWLSDVDCSATRLTQALREGAAEAGGTLLVGRQCYSRQQSSGAVWVVCKADVARPGEQLLAERQADRPPAPLAASEPAAAEAWRIRVHFTPSEAAPRSPRRADQVRELPRMPVSHVPLGSVVTRCKKGCSRAGAHEGVRYAAARLGATDVVDVHCARKGEGWLCTGTAAAYEVDPDRDPRAR